VGAAPSARCKWLCKLSPGWFKASTRYFSLRLSTTTTTAAALTHILARSEESRELEAKINRAARAPLESLSLLGYAFVPAASADERDVSSMHTLIFFLLLREHPPPLRSRGFVLRLSGRKRFWKRKCECRSWKILLQKVALNRSGGVQGKVYK
jgi:hypothetical protein